MIKRSSASKKRNAIIAVALMMCVVLYLAGVFSGLYANKILERKTLSDIQSFKNATERNIQDLESITKEELDSLKGYVGFLETNLKSRQLERIFVETLSQDEECRFLDISMDHLIKELQYYRELLPFRIEEYEKTKQPSKEYYLLKEQYNQLSVSTWIMAKNSQKKCNTSLINTIYFYSADCGNCVEQGEQLDIFNRELVDSGKNVMLFAIDFNSDDLTISLLKEFYNITSLPAIIMNDRIYQGRMVKAEELLKDIGAQDER